MKTERRYKRVKVTPRIHGHVVVVKGSDGLWRTRVFKHQGSVRIPSSVHEGIVGHGPHNVALQVKEAFHAWGVREGWIAPLR